MVVDILILKVYLSEPVSTLSDDGRRETCNKYSKQFIVCASYIRLPKCSQGQVNGVLNFI